MFNRCIFILQTGTSCADLTQLDANACDLDEIVVSAEELEAVVVQSHQISSQVDTLINTRTSLYESFGGLVFVGEIPFADLCTTQGQFADAISWNELPPLSTLLSLDFTHNISCAVVQRKAHVGSLGRVSALTVEASHGRNNCVLSWSIRIICTSSNLRSRPSLSNILSKLLSDERHVL
ncbi:hypothetical protein HG530_015192 [Fusarium avenaceum]|nr:hypothetical protein HG530_015192 [Fusarium avenaceum]